MNEETSTWAVGVMVAVFSLVGIILAAGARDDGMYVFGWSLTAFSIAFIANLMRVSFAEIDHPVKALKHG